ncbi:substrate-binding periplasmic protein [Marinomonas sp. 2405UD68-3]|uniref:substrate-binding periplasmic protein n=1 Tax=Marinomonas sp. 2405UD68-3 TaxID=3391835 RepID=UPI0039C9BDEE
MQFKNTYLISVISTVFSPFILAIDTPRFVTSSFPPLQYIHQEQQSGYVTKLFEKIHLEHKELGNLNIEFLPWKRAMYEAEKKQNLFFFSASRTPERESRFQWVSEISPYGQAIYSLKNSSQTNINSIEELMEKKWVIGVQNGSSMQEYLHNQGVPAELIMTVTDYKTSIKMLFSGRIDAVPLTYFLANGAACSLGFDHSKLQLNFKIDELSDPLWLAASLKTSKETVEFYRNSIEELKHSGWLNHNIQTEISRWEDQMCNT